MIIGDSMICTFLKVFKSVKVHIYLVRITNNSDIYNQYLQLVRFSNEILLRKEGREQSAEHIRNVTEVR